MWLEHQSWPWSAQNYAIFRIFERHRHYIFKDLCSRVSIAGNTGGKYWVLKIVIINAFDANDALMQ